MCTFCEKREPGDSFGEEVIFFEKILRDNCEEVITSLQIDPDRKELVLNLSTADGKLDKEFDKYINYCPLCGKEL
ncbi:hypothetical protein [Butyrivibrio sp. MC2021]|uniref:hypothetical protein n=1 Tax=Butyrivibrio sp. MC2021 TaxID=1408306 RepID=UPI000568F36F|nr:hypothetical protein [Butyrivibrio sp. MC2021]